MWGLPCSCKWQVYYLGVERLPHPALPWRKLLLLIWLPWRELLTSFSKSKHKAVSLVFANLVTCSEVGPRCSPACRGTVPSLQSNIYKTHLVSWLLNFEETVLKVKLSTGPQCFPKNIISKFLGEIYIFPLWDLSDYLHFPVSYKHILTLVYCFVNEHLACNKLVSETPS